MPKGDIERWNTATRRLYDKKYPENREFRGVDGEGGNVADPDALFGERHHYLSLRAGPDLLETGKPLTWQDCFNFLADLPTYSYIYVAYFFDYDVTMMIRTLPEKVARKLLDRHTRIGQNNYIYPVEYEGFLFDYLPHKEFKIKRADAKKWVVINDVGQFFQTAFLPTLQRWGIGDEQELEIIAYGKSQRSNFKGTTEEVEAYNALEVLLLEQLMTNFRAVCFDTGYVPKKWQGPGHLASAMLEAHGIPRREDIPILSNNGFRSQVQSTYYGGRFETTAFGPIPGPVYQYDINGAYVHLLKSLPCLIHGAWRWIRERPTDGRLWFGEVHFNHPADGRLLYNLPVRLKNGNIRYPREGVGNYWSTELEAAERAGTTVDFHTGWVYEPKCECRWFDFVDDYYQQRVALGKSAKGYVLKLAGNSIYGKLAQSIGYAPWANPVWAGMITAGCRAMLIDAYRQDPDNCYMLATDGLFVANKLDLPVSKKLGEWDFTEHPDGIFIVQPGVYFTGDDAKTRGVEKRRIYNMRADFEKAFQETMNDPWGNEHTVKVEVTNFITARLALMRNNWALAGTWDTTERTISFLAYFDKRAAGYSVWRAVNGDMTKQAVRTFPHAGGPDEVSYSYGRIIGGGLVVADEDRYGSDALKVTEEMKDQPDWAETLW